MNVIDKYKRMNAGAVALEMHMSAILVFNSGQLVTGEYLPGVRIDMGSVSTNRKLVTERNSSRAHVYRLAQCYAKCHPEFLFDAKRTWDAYAEKHASSVESELTYRGVYRPQIVNVVYTVRA